VFVAPLQIYLPVAILAVLFVMTPKYTADKMIAI
jgi:hypothetical protein